MSNPTSPWISRVVPLVAIVVGIFLGSPSRSDEPATAANIAKDSAGAGTKRALIICGLSGDAAHHTLFTETLAKMHEGLTKRFGFRPGNVQILFGDKPIESDSELIQATTRSTRENLEKAVTSLRDQLQPEDSLWVIVMGHTHFDNKMSWLNLPGLPDIHQHDFAKLFNGIECQQQVFVISTPTSGYYIKPLSAKKRVIISATEDDFESNETEFPHEFARFLALPPAAKEFDIDNDGQVTLFDLYLTVARNVAQGYRDRDLLATEHSLIDDNGDGRGTEVQVNYLTEDLGGRVRPNRPVKVSLPPNSDGQFSKTIILNPTPAAAPPTTAP